MKRQSIIRTSPDTAPVLLHGGDYNPDQWLDSPQVLEEDIRLMQAAAVNIVSVGIFAWSALEPQPDQFEFDWLDATIERLHAAGVGVFLATPSGARPAWLSKAYPEVLRVAANRRRNLHGGRHNHCYTSPAYRARTRIINQKLARRYAAHPAVKLWHLSNEYSGECHCDLCQEAFRGWLRDRYHNDLAALNAAWWTAFWSHTFNDWSQIESPCEHGETRLHGLELDWKRFVTHQTRDFMRHEIATIKEIDSSIPFTTNLMGFYPGLDYPKLAADIDVVSWDSYPTWHGVGGARGIEPRSWQQVPAQLRDARLARQVATSHDLMRGCKVGRPWLLMESTPSMTNWMPVGKRKRPGAHVASSLLAIAHGSDSVQYFQWRKSRGSSEKFHGAVVDHVGHEHTRVFADCSAVGRALQALQEVAGSEYPADVAVIFDWENRWAINDAQGPRNDDHKSYETTVERHACALSEWGVNVDVIDSEQDIGRYRLVVAPMLYMVKPGVAERIAAFVRAGGVFVATYWSGIVDESDLCFLGGFPGPLSAVLGIWSEEIDALELSESNTVVPTAAAHAWLAGAAPDVPIEPADPAATSGQTAAGSGQTAAAPCQPAARSGQRTVAASAYQAYELCDLIHLKGATALAHYGCDFYAGRPALTVNRYGAGRAYYIASRNDDAFLADLYGALVRQLNPVRAYPDQPADGVHVALRRADNDDGTTSLYRFAINFATDAQPAPALQPGETVLFFADSAADGSAAAAEDSATAAGAGVPAVAGAPAARAGAPSGAASHAAGTLAPYAVRVTKTTVPSPQ